LIGNDIIDLSLAETESNWQRKGFLAKQFTIKEQAIILDAENSFEMVWRLWSMKEAGYKIWARCNEKRVFSPKNFECNVISASEGFVCFKDQKFYTTTNVDVSYIFTVASLEKKIKSYSSIGPSYGIDQSIKKKLEEETGIPASEIEQIKSKNGVPSYYHRSEIITQSCSITHHGNYGAFSIVLS